MKRIIVATALLALFSGAALADPAFNTTGGYGNGVINAVGATYVDTEGKKPTYSYSPAALLPAAAATDVVVLTGSATKTIRVVRACVDGLATTPVSFPFYLIKRTTADTGGTATNPTPTKHDTNDAAASATLSLYTANPTTGTGTTIQSGVLWLTNAGIKDWRCVLFGDNADEKLVLRGVAEQFAINHGGATQPSGGSLHYRIEWTEAND
jgi:opacity protein-like surface antigen